MSLRAAVECPRCHRIWYAQQGMPEVDCNCHLYCEDGEKPEDCTLVDHTQATHDAWQGDWSWPHGIHTDASHNGDDTQARVKYCTTHDKYVDKVPITVPIDWERWFSKRAPSKFRMSKGKY